MNFFNTLSQDRWCLAEKAEHEARMFVNLFGLIRRFFGSRKDLRILEIGSGVYKQIIVLLNAVGYCAVGIDNYSHAPRLGNFRERIISKYKQRYFYRRLGRAYRLRLNPAAAQVRQAEATSLPFSDGEFDLIYSHAVFEHIQDVPRSVAEMHRVLKSGGVANIGIHLFASLSGSHHPLIRQHPVVEMPAGVPPWYHLRGLPGEIPADLNRYREHQYQKCFEKYFQVIEKIYHVKEGEHLLTAEILDELSAYSREELLRRNVIFNLRKA